MFIVAMDTDMCQGLQSKSSGDVEEMKTYFNDVL